MYHGLIEKYKIMKIGLLDLLHEKHGRNIVQYQYHNLVATNIHVFTRTNYANTLIHVALLCYSFFFLNSLCWKYFFVCRKAVVNLIIDALSNLWVTVESKGSSAASSSRSTTSMSRRFLAMSAARVLQGGEIELRGSYDSDMCLYSNINTLLWAHKYVLVTWLALIVIVMILLGILQHCLSSHIQHINSFVFLYNLEINLLIQHL